MREYGSEFDFEKVTDRKVFQELFTGFGAKAFLRCGREAIRLCARQIIDQHNIRTVYIPSLSCNSMYQPFIDAGFEVKFYQINAEFLPQLEIPENESAVIFIMFYYGITDLSYIRSMVKHYSNCVVVADVTHICFDPEAYVENFDYIVSSMRKSMGVVNGGVALSAKHKLIQPKYVPNEFTSLRYSAFEEKMRYGEKKSTELKNHYRALFAKAENKINDEKKLIGADPESIAYLTECDVKKIARARRANYSELYDRIKDIEGVEILTKFDLAEKTVPFSLPILVENRDGVQRRLADLGVYAPVLWPLSDSARAMDNFAAKIEQKMLSLPIDQRYGYEDMLEIADRLKEVLS